MSRARRQPEEMSAGGADLVVTALYALSLALCADVVGIIGQERDGRLFVIPKPGVGPDLFRELGRASWDHMRRQAEEYTA